MLSYQELKEIAARFRERNPDNAAVLLALFAERYPADRQAVALASSDPSFACGTLVALFQRTKTACPLLKREDAILVLSAFNGVMLYSESLSTLAYNLAGHVFQGVIQEPESEPLRREIEEPNGDPEFSTLLMETPPARLAAMIRSLPGESALALLVAVSFWWSWRSLQQEESIDRRDPNSLQLENFFRID